MQNFFAYFSKTLIKVVKQIEKFSLKGIAKST